MDWMAFSVYLDVIGLACGGGGCWEKLIGSVRKSFK